MLRDYKPQLDTPKRQKRLSLCYLQAAVGASGAPTLDEDNSAPQVAITRDSAGVYSIEHLPCRFFQPVSAVLTETDVSPVAADGKIGGFASIDKTAGTFKVVFSAGDDGLISEVTDGSRINITWLVGK